MWRRLSDERDKAQRKSDAEFAKEKYGLLQKAAIFLEPQRDQRTTELQHQLKIAKEIELELHTANPRVLGDREVALAVLKGCGTCLRHFSEKLRSDPEIVKLALSSTPTAFQYAGESLRGDKPFLMKTLGISPRLLGWATDALRNDREVVLEAVRRNGEALQHASANLRSDRGVVLTAVQQRGVALSFASDDLRACKDVVRAAVASVGAYCDIFARGSHGGTGIQADLAHRGSGLRFAADRLREDRGFAKEMVNQHWSALVDVSLDLRSDPEVMASALRQFGGALCFAANELKADRGTVLEAVKQQGCWLQFAHPHLKGDKDLALAALRVCPDETGARLCYEEISESLKKEFPWHIFRAIYVSKLAAPGQRAPVLSVTLSAIGFVGASRGVKRRYHDENGPGNSGSSSSNRGDTDSRNNHASSNSNNSINSINSSITGSFQCDVSLVSGANFQVEVPATPPNGRPLGWPWPVERKRPGLFVCELADILVQELPKRTEVVAPDHVFITFMMGDGSFFSATAWHWDQPLSDLL